MLARAEHAFAADSDERERSAPRRLTCRAVLNVHSGVAVRIATDRPFESKVQQSRMVYEEPACLGCVLRESG